jgi:aspartate 1-decarboxylase
MTKKYFSTGIQIGCNACDAQAARLNAIFANFYDKIHQNSNAMIIERLKSKVHRAVVTEANLNYVGSLTLDEDLMDAANMIEHEKITVVNVNNGERLETYLITGERGSGICCLNGPAARKGAAGDVIIIISYASMEFEEAKRFKPRIIFPKDGNRL